MMHLCDKNYKSSNTVKYFNLKYVFHVIAFTIVFIPVIAKLNFQHPLL